MVDTVRSLLDDPRLRRIGPALAVTLFAVGGLAVETRDPTSTPGVAAFSLCLAAGAALLVRERTPLPVAIVVAVARVGVAELTGDDGALVPAAMLALYTLARSGDRRRSVVAALAVGVPMSVAVAGVSADPFFEEFPGEAALMLLPIAFADGVRSRADRLTERIETEASARVQAERLRIARDLHDVVAHSLSVVTVQSGVAAHLIDRDTAQAKDALEVINSTGKHALEELRTMVGVLRSTDDDPPRTPTPTDPDDLSALLAGAERAGVHVTVERDGSFPPDVGDAAVVAVHRILQEALTNVARHAGPVEATVRLRHRAAAVDLLVRNAPGAAEVTAPPSTGVGVIGMTERAASLGGTLTAGPTADGGFEVAATVPYQTAGEART